MPQSRSLNVVTGCKIERLRCQGGNNCLVNTIFHLFCQNLPWIRQKFWECWTAGVTVFQGKASHFPVVLHLCQEARASRFPAPFPGLTPPTSLHLVFLVLKSMVQQILGIPLKPLSGNVVGASAIAEVMVRQQLSRRRCCKPRNPKMGYHLGSQDLACHLSGLPSLHPALQTYFWNTIYLLRWSKAKVDAVASTFPPTTVGLFLPNLKCQKGPPRLVFLGPPSGYDLPRYPPVAWWGVRFYFLQSVLWETLYWSYIFFPQCHRF